ncbi:two-component regulator propeller domain-containing protein [Cecembia rubra]|uniref:ligand-binding sensor domain-containing protein n=1 Tax=Cecembia rubra TaxID=1485585 RepID=UPI00271487F9|nr:two-component regulator propeller domain-containing protein [Cecembia rubra]
MKKLLQVIPFLILALPSFAQEFGIPFSKYYSSKEYNGGIQNFSIGQDQNGLIYVANNFGLLEYDGTTWERHPLPNSTKIRDLLIENNKRIYIAGQGQLGYFRPNHIGRMEFISWITQLPLKYQNVEEVWKIFKIHERLIFCTIKNLFIFDQNGALVNIIESIGEFESFHLSNNQLYFQDSEKGLLKLEKNEAVLLSDKAKLKTELLSGILETTSGELQVFTEKGEIYLFSSQNLNSWSPLNLPKLSKVNKAIRLRNGNIAVGTQYDGLYVLKENGSLELHMNQEKGLQNNTVISIFEDKSGNLWLGHNNGITLLELSLPFRLLGPEKGILGTGYAAKLFQEDIYLGTNIETGKMSGSGEKITKISNSEGQAYSFGQIEGNLLMGHNEGAFLIKNDRADPIPGVKGVWGFLPLKDRPNLILAGTYKGLVLFEEKNGNYFFVRKLKGFEESCRLIQQDELGNIWMSHGYKGIYKLSLSDDLTEVNYKFYGNKEGLPTNLLNSVWKIGGRVVFTTEYGIYIYNPSTDRFEKDAVFSPYFDNEFLITSLVEDPIGNIFYIGNKEVGVLEKQSDGTFQKNHQIFNKIIPLLNDDLQNVSLLRSNEVLFAANEGFIWYKLDINKIMPPTYPAFIKAVYLTKPGDSLLALGKHIEMMEQKFGTEGKGLELPFNQADIRFEFTNSIPNNENTTQFRFWLEGLESEYGEWTNKRDKAYTNLREGKYTFHVQSKDIYGQIAEAIPFNFTVLPPWYRTSLAWFIYLIASVLFILLAYKKVDKQYQKKTQALTARQKKELEEKSKDLRNSQQELEKLKTEKLEVEIENKNKELASATMHLLNKNGFIDQTKSQLSLIIKKSKNQEVKNELQKVIHSIDKNIAEDDDWKQFEIHFDQVHGDFMHRFKRAYPNLSPQEIKLTAYLRMNLSTKEIAFLMNISPRGVEISRYRLRKKLQLERSDNLQEFILKF